MSKKEKVVTSAVIVMPPKDLWDGIQALREENDKAFDRWPPHINMLYPFVGVEDFPEAAYKIAKAVSVIPSFNVTFNDFGQFPHGTVFCNPAVETPRALHDLQAAMQSVFPICNDLSIKADGYHPHLTVGSLSAGEQDMAIGAFLSNWSPISFTVGEVYMIARKDSDPFRIHYKISFNGNVEQVDIPYTPVRTTVAPVEEGTTEEDQITRPGFQISNTHARIMMELPVGAVSSIRPISAPQLIFVLDVSGSMSSDLQQVKKAVEYMISTGPTIPPLFIAYDTKAWEVDVHAVAALRTGDSTSFEAAINQLRKTIEGLSGTSNISVVFMTDGGDNASKDLPSVMKKFSTFVTGRNDQKIVIHTIGFGSSCATDFLNRLCKIGTTDGMYRYVQQKAGLEASFSEIFDFLDITRSYKLSINGNIRDVEVEIKKLAFNEEVISVDLIVPRSSPDFAFLNGKEEVEVQLEDVVVPLKKLDGDIYFQLRGVEAMDITDQESLNVAQQALVGINPLKAPKAQRQSALTMKGSIQDQLDKYHQTFADISRGTISAGNVASALQSMRYDFKFNKARRMRTLNQRAVKNASVFSGIDKQLAGIKLSKEQLDTFAALDYVCSLSGDTIYEVMSGSKSDVMMFSLRVTRPEHAIDAPSEVGIKEILAGTYSYAAFQEAMKYALRQKPAAQQVHGGFSTQNDENVGFFKGLDGKYMNACLPFYINEHHWERVEHQLAPILGYFFTLDPLGFKGDQYLALFMILGNMLLLRANGEFKSEWADWLIADFTKLCAAVKPKLLSYLKAGLYASGKLTTDPLPNFLSGPGGRTKQVIPNIISMFGLAAVDDNHDKNRFNLCIVEEIWRRNFSNYYKTHPRQMVLDLIEKLIYGPPVEEEAEGGDSSDKNNNNNNNKNKNKNKTNTKFNKNDKDFQEWAEMKLNKSSSKKNAEETQKKFGDVGPPIEGLLAEDEGYVSRSLVNFETHKEYLMNIVNEQLAKISASNQYFVEYTNRLILGEKMEDVVKWALLVQALQFCSNDLANAGVADGSYKNTVDYLSNPTELMTSIHQFFDKYRRESHVTTIREKNFMHTAQQLVNTKILWAFVGRMMKSCPTRGGNVFDFLIAQLQTSSTPIPLLAEKLDIIFTGKLRLENEVLSVHAEGVSWVHCTTEVAKKLKQAVGEEAFTKIEVSMYGQWGWVYRPSDIPNRHKHCNSNPNLSLGMNFKGFGV